jgi:CubicO group peptidase (beta-lactamase class C family)
MIVFIFLCAIKCAGQSDLLQKYMEIQYQRIHFNGTVLVAKNDQPLFQFCVGKASQELDIPVKADNIFPIASITKQFTALLVVLATQEGRLALTDSLPMFFPELTDTSWRKITLHQLLSHTSGIPHNEGITDYWTMKACLPLSKKQALAEIFEMKLLFDPGAKMKYSSPGYLLLASILETVYNRSYGRLLSEKILEPLQMDHTGEMVTGKVIPGMVSGYHLLNDCLIVAPHRDYSLMMGSGHLYSMAAQLAKWNNSFSTRRLWNDSVQKLLFTPHTDTSPYYGYGWFIRPGKRVAYYHGGGSFGCSALSAWYPIEQLSIIILSNVSQLPVTEMWNDIEKIVFKEPFDMPEIIGKIQMSASELGKYAGKYFQNQQQLDIIIINDGLYAKLGANPAFEIYPEKRCHFFGKKVNVRFIFKEGDDGNITGLEANLRGQDVGLFKKMRN